MQLSPSLLGGFLQDGEEKKKKKVGQRRWLVIPKIFTLMGMSMWKAEGLQQEVYS